MGDRGRALYAAFVGNLDSSALVPVIALYAIALGADLLMVGIIVGAYSIVHAPANIAFGRVVDRIGRRQTLVIGLLADAGSLVLYVLAANPLHLLGARLLHGFGGGLVGPASMSVVADSAKRGGHGRTMALYGISLGVAVVIGFGLAGGLVLVEGSVRDAMPLLIGVLVVVLGTGVASSLTLEQRRSEPAPPGSGGLAVLRRPDILPAVVLMFSLYFGIGSFVSLYPTLVTDLLGAGAERTVVSSFIVFGITSIVFHYPGGVVTDRFGPRRSASFGLLALGGGFLVLPLVAGSFANLGAMVLLGVGHAFVFPASSAALARAAPKGHLGFATGWLYAGIVSGTAVGAPVMSAVAGGVGLPLGLALTAIVPILAVSIALRLHRQDARHPAANPTG